MDNSEQRSTPRYRCRCYATLMSTNTTWEAHLINLSQTGALVAILTENDVQAGDTIDLLIELDSDDIVNLKGRVAHVKAHYVGIACAPLTQNDFARHMHKLEALGREKNAD